MEPSVHIHGPGPEEGFPSGGHEETHFVQKRETFAKKEPPEAMNKKHGVQQKNNPPNPRLLERMGRISQDLIYPPPCLVHAGAC